MDKPKKNISWLNLLSIVLIVLLTGEVVLLLQRNRELASELEKLTGPAMEPLKEGDAVPPIRVLTLDDDTAAIEYTEPTKKRLLFVFTVTCPHCLANLPAWNLITQKLQQHGGVEVFGVSMDTLPQTQRYVTEKDVRFFPVSVVDTAFMRAYKIVGFPETILIDHEGRVQKVWIGELSDNHLEEILGLMGA